MPQSIQPSFTSGELTPATRSRVDIAKYATGLSLCQNFFVRPQGGVYSRAGFRYVDNIGDMTKVGRLIPFSFNTQQTYALVFEHLTMRVVKNGAYVMKLDSPYEIVTPYTEAELDRIGFVQDADVMTLVHPSHDPRNLSRLADDNWTITAINFAPTMSPPAAPALTLVGTGAGTYDKTYQYVITAVDVDGVESVASTMASITTPSLAVTAGLHLAWSAVAGADRYRVYKDPSVGTGVFGWIGDVSAPNVTFDDYNIAPITSDAPPEDRQPFTAVDDKPSVTSYYQQRKIYANTNNEPRTVFTSQTGVYDSMRKSFPTRDDDAVTFTVKANQVNEIRHIVSMDDMIILTAGAAWKLTTGADKVLTPSTIGVRMQSQVGASWVPPVVINSTVLYLQDKGGRLRDLGYEFAVDKYTGDDLSLIASHLIEGYDITSMAYTEIPDSIVWLVRSDGVLLGFTYQRAQKVWGWHQHVTDGFVESITSIQEGNADVLYLIVRRVINGSTVRYIEKMDTRVVTSAADSFCVDSGLSYNGVNTSATTMTLTTSTDYLAKSTLTITASVASFAAGDVGDAIVFTDKGVDYTVVIDGYTSTTVVTGTCVIDIPIGLQATATTTWSFARNTMSGLGHLEGKPVAVLADGNEVKGLTISSGVITLPRPAVKVHIGLPYLPVIETLDIDTGDRFNTLKGKEINIAEVILEVEDSRGGWIGRKDDVDGDIEQMFEIKPRYQIDQYDSLSLRTFRESVMVHPTWSKGGGMRIEQRSPLPLAILSIIPRFDASGG